MKQLSLIRHSFAESGNAKLSDRDRRLSQNGRSVAKEIFSDWPDYMQKPDMVYVSSAKRTRNTWDILNGFLNLGTSRVIYSDGLYKGSGYDYLSFILGLSDDFDKVVLIGHNPSISELGMKLSKGFNRGFSPCTCLHLKTPANSWLDADKGYWEPILLQQPDHY